MSNISHNKEVCWWGTFDNSLRDPNHFVRVEWMQFIYSVNKLIREQKELSVYTDTTDMSEIGGFGSPNKLGKDLQDSVNNKHWSGFEIYPSWIVYLDSGRKEAFIECTNRDMEDVAIRAFRELHP